MNFPNKQAKSFKILEKVLFLYKNITSSGNTSQSLSPIFIYQLSNQNNLNRFNLFGAVVSLTFQLLCITRGHMKTVRYRVNQVVYIIRNITEIMKP